MVCGGSSGVWCRKRCEFKAVITLIKKKKKRKKVMVDSEQVRKKTMRCVDVK